MRANGERPARMADIHDFHNRYLYADHAPVRRPYIRPFKSRGKGPQLFNPNVSGSYSPSSIRAKGRLVDVVVVSGRRQNAEYNLKPDHATAALNSLLVKKRVPAVSLAAFLYRDYGFMLEEPLVDRVLNIFRDEFGLRADVPAERANFEILFENDSVEFQDSDLQPLAATNG